MESQDMQVDNKASEPQPQPTEEVVVTTTKKQVGFSGRYLFKLLLFEQSA